MKLTEPIVGYAIDVASVQDCASTVTNWIKCAPVGKADSDCRWLACMNPHSFAVTLDDAAFAAGLHDADWLIPDGFGVVLASRILGGKIRKRVTGSDIFHFVMDDLNRTGHFKIFFLGSTQETLDAIVKRVAIDYPNLILAGTLSPSFKPAYTESELTAMVEVINAASPDVLWVGLTAPKQEKWIHQNRHRLKVRFAGAIGAVFDFYSGRIERSHPIFQRIGLEWLPRLLQEPRRLWRRMGVSAPIFVWHVLRQRFSL